MAPLVVPVIATKIHTVDWSIELLKMRTRTLEIGMVTNWFGLPHAMGLKAKWLPPLFCLIQNRKLVVVEGLPYDVARGWPILHAPFVVHERFVKAV